jgi:hypothetical protein
MVITMPRPLTFIAGESRGGRCRTFARKYRYRTRHTPTYNTKTSAAAPKAMAVLSIENEESRSLTWFTS